MEKLIAWSLHEVGSIGLINSMGLYKNFILTKMYEKRFLFFLSFLAFKVQTAIFGSLYIMTAISIRNKFYDFQYFFADCTFFANCVNALQNIFKSYGRTVQKRFSVTITFKIPDLRATSQKSTVYLYVN
jgi:hypothetical protein